ncbi:MAG: hypothetical protein LWW77_00475 [Propionibacteriales bacterium]|nr:hypothetical protein [Propionibacteriales bacterium]
MRAMNAPSRWAAALITLALAIGSLAAAPAWAGGGADCDINSDNADCGIQDIDPGDPANPSDPGHSSKPSTPLCSAFPNGVPDDPPSSDWIYIECQLTANADDGTIGLWVEPRASAEQIARTLLARISFKPIDIGLAPKGADAMALVGMPVWLWVDDPSETTYGPASISAGGMRLTAKVTSVGWVMGDGAEFVCGKGTEWKKGMGGDPSPTCGHTYSKRGTYTVRATTHWVAHWTGYGLSGDIPFELTRTRQLEVGELQVIIKRGG